MLVCGYCLICCLVTVQWWFILIDLHVLCVDLLGGLVFDVVLLLCVWCLLVVSLGVLLLWVDVVGACY